MQVWQLEESLSTITSLSELYFRIRRFILSGDNTEKIWAHWFFAKQKRNMPKACKTSAGGLGGAVSPAVGPGQSPGGGSGAPKIFEFFCEKRRETLFPRVKIQ